MFGDLKVTLDVVSFGTSFSLLTAYIVLIVLVSLGVLVTVMRFITLCAKLHCSVL